MLRSISFAAIVLLTSGCATEFGGNGVSGLDSFMGGLGEVAEAAATSSQSNSGSSSSTSDHERNIERIKNETMDNINRNQAAHDRAKAQKAQTQRAENARITAANNERKAQAARDARERTRLAQVERNRQIAATAERNRQAATSRPSLSNTAPPKMVKTPTSEWGPISTLHFNSGKDWEIGQDTGEQAFGGFMIKIIAKRAQMSNRDPSRRAVAYFRNISGNKMCISSTVSTKPPTRTNESTTVPVGQTKYNTDNYFDKSAAVVYVMVQTKVCD